MIPLSFVATIDEIETREENCEIKYVGSQSIDEKNRHREELTYVFEHTWSDPNGINGSRMIDAVRIGCPNCNENSNALIHVHDDNVTYNCHCGYSNDLTRQTLLLNGVELNGVWEPY